MSLLQELFDLTGRRAIVTGGSSGIGREIAGALARVGARVAIVNRTRSAGEAAAAELSREGGPVRAYPADVSQEDQVREAVAAIEADQGPTDILVNSHGINIRRPALEFSLQEWRSILDINLTGVFLTCREVGRGMVARGFGRVVNISSIAALAALTDRAAYGASKGGVSQLTKCLALEWAGAGVTVNALGPGYMRTPLISQLFRDPAFEGKVRSQVPLGRIGEPQELLGLVLLLCSKAGGYITGQTIFVDGGWSII